MWGIWVSERPARLSRLREQEQEERQKNSRMKAFAKRQMMHFSELQCGAAMYFCSL